ncbi:MAG TPA: ATP-binding cassette domain-containing protein [Bacteroidales bacterium]|nr:ATP-binding cassette domain-containing protein [Bacteroidales bacterium]HSA44561.1 ATP-binding cassette domain-containing protein [Bacteroidales bacterium]
MLEVRQLTRSFGDFSLQNISFTVERGDYFVILGLSGAGKSLLLELLAGLELPDSGQILLNGKDITREKIQRRPFGLVFQDLAIFPHLSVRANIAYSLNKREGKATAGQEKLTAITRDLGIRHLLDRRPETLSGGELQRVALARVLVHDPEILLLDEPLASIDVSLKAGIRSLLRKLHRNGQTIIHVTHDEEEAVSLAGKIAVIQDGAIIQQGTPGEVFSKPGSPFVARFAGHPNFFTPRLEADPESGKPLVRLSNALTINIPPTMLRGKICLIIDPAAIRLFAEKPPAGENVFQAMIREIYPSRQGLEILLDAGIPLLVKYPDAKLPEGIVREGDTVWAMIAGNGILCYQD